MPSILQTSPTIRSFKRLTKFSLLSISTSANLRAFEKATINGMGGVPG